MKLTKLKKGAYLRESDSGNFSIVHPIKDDDGKFIWKNFLVGGSYYNLLKVAFILALIIFLSWSYRHDINACRDLMEHPEKVCIRYFSLHTYDFGGETADNELFNISAFEGQAGG